MLRELLRVANANSIGAATKASDDVRGDPITQALVIVFDVTQLAGTVPTLQLIVELRDDISGKYASFGTFTAINAVGTYSYVIGKGVGAAADGVTATRGFPPPGSYR